LTIPVVAHQSGKRFVLGFSAKPTDGSEREYQRVASEMSH
jgi:hypothetical protein